jgi:hypothetical protein
MHVYVGEGFRCMKLPHQIPAPTGMTCLMVSSWSVNADAFPPMVHTVGTCGPDTYRQIMVYADLGVKGSSMV